MASISTMLYTEEGPWKEELSRAFAFFVLLSFFLFQSEAWEARKKIYCVETIDDIQTKCIETLFFPPHKVINYEFYCVAYVGRAKTSQIKNLKASPV